MMDSISLFDTPEDQKEPEIRPGRKWMETSDHYKQRTGLDFVKPPTKKSQMGTSRTSNTDANAIKKAVESVEAAQLDPLMVRAYGKRMLIFMQSRDIVVKFLVTELGIDSAQAEREVSEMLGEIRADFTNYLMSSDEQNIMTLREMMKLALERHDTRSATDIMRTLDTITNHYLEVHDMLPEKKKKEDSKEIEIIFT